MKPKWIKEPADISVELGSELNIDCAAVGHPEPKTKLEKLLNGSPNISSTSLILC